MAGVSRKTEIDAIDGTPQKRFFLSIISDYNLRTGLCELVDNAIDLWMLSGRKAALNIKITLDAAAQMILVSDNAGGVKEFELPLLVSPGATRNISDEEIIGMFGVGGKRAGIALGRHVEIRTRFKKERSLQLDLTEEWLANDDWSLAAYEIPDIRPGTTTVEISKLRQQFDEAEIDEIRCHLGETYSWFLEQGCSIDVNGDAVAGVKFDSWAYPPAYPPRRATFQITPTDKTSQLVVTLEAGLISDRDPEAENYGVYFYCNHRLVVKELRVRDVGYFVTGEAGVPHPDASLCRVIVTLQGGAELMPWTSSKSGINFNHPAFKQIRSQIIDLVSYFTSLSRRLKTQWDEQVFAHLSGEMEEIDPQEILANRKLALPKLPRTRRLPRIEELRASNRKQLDSMPWTIGLVEAMGLIEVVGRQKLETRNRAALILLDSNFEIALKEYITNNPSIFPPGKYPNSKIQGLFESGRRAVIQEVGKHVSFPANLLAKVNHYYLLRNSLIHERATQQITDAQVRDYRTVVEKVLRLLFNLKFPT